MKQAPYVLSAPAITGLQMATVTYFSAERTQMGLVIGGAIVVAVLAVYLFVSARDVFSRSFMITVLVCASVLGGTAAAMLARGMPYSPHAASSGQNASSGQALTQELSRITTVVNNYQRYRLLAVGIALLALAGLSWPQRPGLHGVAAGFLLLVLAQVIIDHYSESNARRYRDAIEAFAAFH